MRRFALFLPCVVLWACSAGGVLHRNDTSHRTPAEQKKFAAAVARGEVKVGMTPNEVRQAYGKPGRVDKTTWHGRPVTRWAYAFSEIYFHREGYVLGWRSAY